MYYFIDVCIRFTELIKLCRDSRVDVKSFIHPFADSMRYEILQFSILSACVCAHVIDHKRQNDESTTYV